MKNVIENKNVWFPKKLYDICKKYWGKIVHLKKIYKFTSDHFLIGQVVFILIVKNLMKKKKIALCTKSMRDTRKMLVNKNKFLQIKHYS